jgi:hypothetical protein
MPLIVEKDGGYANLSMSCECSRAGNTIVASPTKNPRLGNKVTYYH